MSAIRSLAILVASALLCCPWSRATERSEEALLAAFEEYFGRATKDELKADDPEAVHVTRILADSPASRSKLRVGDRILAVDGFRVHSYHEFEYVRFVLQPESRRIAFTVARGDRVGRVVLRGLAPLRRPGFLSDGEPLHFARMLEDLGVKFAPDLRPAIARFPRRPVHLLKEWLDESPAGLADVGWLQGFVDLYGHMVRQEWDLARSLERGPSVPYFARLASFYVSVAERHRTGEKPPDPAAHGVPLEFFVFNYPFPETFVVPELGELRFKDQRLARLFALRHDQGPASLEEREEEAESYNVWDQNPVQAYLNQVTKALIDPHHNGGWPYRSWLVSKKPKRETMIDAIQGLLDQGEGGEFLCKAALLGPLVMEGRDDKVVELIAFLRTDSPFLGYACACIVHHAARHHNRDEMKQRITDYMTERPFGPPARDSLLYRHIRKRTRHMRGKHELETDVGRRADYLARNPLIFATALTQPRPLEEEARLLDEEIERPDFVARRAELYGRCVALAKFRFLEEDNERLMRLNRDGQAYGLQFDALRRCLYWDCYTSAGASKVPPWAFFIGNLGQWTNIETYPLAVTALSRVRWDDEQAALQEVRAIWKQYGWLVSTLVIADALEDHGHGDLAGELRDQVVQYHRSENEVMEDFTGLGDTRGWYFWHALQTFCHSKATAELALREWHRYLKTRPEVPDHNETDYLYLARAYLHLDRPGEAVRAVIRSLEVKPDPGPYMFAGKGSRDSDEYRAHLLRLIAAHQGFTEDMKSEIKQSWLAPRMRAVVEELFGDEGLPPVPKEEVF